MNFDRENAELLEPETQDDEKSEPTKASNREKRNTKKDIISKIKQICDEHKIQLSESDTTLSRSSKIQLQKLLAQKTEALIQKKIGDKMKINSLEENEGMREMMGLATLHLGLSTLNKMIDKGANTILPKMGYRLQGFREAFEDPQTDREVREILLCILRENPDMLQHISNPYIRLGLVYFGAVTMSLKKYQPNINYYEEVSDQKTEDVQALGCPTVRQS